MPNKILLIYGVQLMLLIGLLVAPVITNAAGVDCASLGCTKQITPSTSDSAQNFVFTVLSSLAFVLGAISLIVIPAGAISGTIVLVKTKRKFLGISLLLSGFLLLLCSIILYTAVSVIQNLTATPFR
jgi:hypothetical protein